LQRHLVVRVAQAGDAMSKRKRFKLTLAEVGYLAEVDRYIRQYDVRGYALKQAFSDVHDGGLYLTEIKHLVQIRLLRMVKYDEHDYLPDESIYLIGQTSTVDLTDKAVLLFWPGRVNAKVVPISQPKRRQPRESPAFKEAKMLSWLNGESDVPER